MKKCSVIYMWGKAASTDFPDTNHINALMSSLKTLVHTPQIITRQNLKSPGTNPSE